MVCCSTKRNGTIARILHLVNVEQLRRQFTMIKNTLRSSTLIVALLIAAPAFAQSQIDNNQPVRGDLHTREAELQNKLNASYDAGYISSSELAAFQRDLDGILVKEERQKSKASGLTETAYDGLSKDLDIFEGRLARHSTKLGAVTTPGNPTTSRQAAVDISNKDAEPILVPIGRQMTGNQSSIVQPTRKVLLVPTSDAVVVPYGTRPGTVVIPPVKNTALPVDPVMIQQ